MKFRANVDEWLDPKCERDMREYFRLLEGGEFELDVYPSDKFISEKLRRYLFGLVRLILNFHKEELGQEDITIRKILHEIEDALNPKYEIFIHSKGIPASKWYNNEALEVKDILQTVYAPRGLYLPDPREGYDKD